MTGRVVRVVAPSRLHFGMLSVNQPGVRHYGGVGAMIDAPGLEIVLRPAPRLETAGPLADRVRQAALLAARSLPGGGGDPDSPACRIEVTRAPPLHVGLGTGTQLAMAVAAGLNALWDWPAMDAARLAQCVGRGHRSAIGLYGFVLGGLLYESGKAANEVVAPLVDRVDIPPAWRFVLVRPRDERGLSDEAERDAFADLPPVPPQWTEMLRKAATKRLLPAARQGDFVEFSEVLYWFGYAAGLSFAAEQGGAFAGPRLAALVAWIRERGVAGVGQSSWGPTLFAVVPDESAAAELAQRLRAHPDAGELEVTIASPDNRGARIESCPDD